MSTYFPVHLGVVTDGRRIRTVPKNATSNYPEIRYFARKAHVTAFKLFGWDHFPLNPVGAPLRCLARLATLYAELSFDGHSMVTSAHQGRNPFLFHATTVFELFSGKDLFVSAFCVEGETPSFIPPTR